MGMQVECFGSIFNSDASNATTQFPHAHLLFTLLKVAFAAAPSLAALPTLSSQSMIFRSFMPSETYLHLEVIRILLPFGNQCALGSNSVKCDSSKTSSKYKNTGSLISVHMLFQMFSPIHGSENSREAVLARYVQNRLLNLWKFLNSNGYSTLRHRLFSTFLFLKLHEDGGFSRCATASLQYRSRCATDMGFFQLPAPMSSPGA